MSEHTCEHCGLDIEPIYAMKPDEGFVHVAPGDKPNHQYCKSGRTWAEPQKAEATDGTV